MFGSKPEEVWWKRDGLRAQSRAVQRYLEVPGADPARSGR